MSFQFTIIVPVYNEEDNLERVEKELLAYTKIATKNTCILFVNDGSKDDSQTIIEAICSRNINFNYISFEDVIKKGLNVMDSTAFTLSQENKLPIVIFDMNKAGNLLKICKGENIGTEVNI